MREKTFEFIYEHSCLNDNEYFPFGALKLSIHHGKGQTETILIDSVKLLLKALQLYKGREEK